MNFIEVKTKWSKRPIFNKRKVGFLFDMGMWGYLSEYTGLGLNEVGTLKDEDFIYKVYYCAAFTWCLRHRIKIDFDELHIKWVFGEMRQKDAQAIFNCLLKSRIGGESIEGVFKKAIESEKKK